MNNTSIERGNFDLRNPLHHITLRQEVPMHHTISDQVPGITESSLPRDLCHEELSNKIATLETIILQLCQQVQLLTVPAAQQQDPLHTRVYMHRRDKRPDRKDNPRKHKKSQQHSALSSDTNNTDAESAPMDEDCLTVWDNYTPKPKDD